MIRAVLLCLGLILSSAAAIAQPRGGTDVLFELMRLSEILDIMHEEGVVYGRDLESELFLGRGGAAWDADVNRVYDLARMEAVVRQRFEAEFEGTDTEILEAFFASDRGRQIISLEVSARRALLDEAVDEASRAALDDMIVAQDPRFALLRDYVEANALIDANVESALNSNYAFYRGLADGGAFAGVLTDDQILTDVWNQEPSIREDTEEWVYSYLALAYQPLSDDDIEAYIALSRTEAGMVLNRALFAAFNEMFVMISRGLGSAAARYVTSEEL